MAIQQHGPNPSREVLAKIHAFAENVSRSGEGVTAIFWREAWPGSTR